MNLDLTCSQLKTFEKESQANAAAVRSTNLRQHHLLTANLAPVNGSVLDFDMFFVLGGRREGDE